MNDFMQRIATLERELRSVKDRLVKLETPVSPPMELHGQQYRSSREVARLLGVSTSLLTKATWGGRIDPPQKDPSGNFLWTRADIERASWVLKKCPSPLTDDPELGGEGEI